MISPGLFYCSDILEVIEYTTLRKLWKGINMVEVPLVGYIALGILAAGLIGFAIWRAKTGRNNSNKND